MEKACGNRDQGKRVVFLGFAHVSIPEYGTRKRLNETDQDRLETVSGRFRTPSINIRLSVTETEGYHSGRAIATHGIGPADFRQSPASTSAIGGSDATIHGVAAYSPTSCYCDIASSLLSNAPGHRNRAHSCSRDQIAQINRTTFYYMQDDGTGGLTGILRTRKVSDLAELGGAELRVSDLFYYFEEAIRIEKRELYDQYQESLAMFPAANYLDKALLRTVLVLSVVADANLRRPRLSFVSARRTHCEEIEAQPVHDSLRHLAEAGSLWKNEATDVWRFVGGPGVSSEIDQEVEAELDLCRITSLHGY